MRKNCKIGRINIMNRYTWHGKLYVGESCPICLKFSIRANDFRVKFQCKMGNHNSCNYIKVHAITGQVFECLCHCHHTIMEDK